MTPYLKKIHNYLIADHLNIDYGELRYLKGYGVAGVGGDVMDRGEGEGFEGGMLVSSIACCYVRQC
jgi:hypothetical protein